MKQILHSLALCGSLLALASCAATDPVEEPGNDPEAGNVTLTATLERSADTRTGHAEDYDGPGVLVSWASGDAIKIVNGEDRTKSATFTFTGFEGYSESGIFSGKAEPGESSSGYYALYPATTILNVEGEVYFDMTGQTQWGDGNMAHLGAYDVMCHYIQTDWKSFTFKESDHVNALMTFDLTGIPADLGRPQSITLGCTKEGSFYNNTSSVNNVSTLELKLTGFASPTEGTPVDIKAYLMMVITTIKQGESLIITVKGEKNSYTFTAPAMTADMDYKAGKRYTATVGAGQWTKVFSGDTYTGAEAAVDFTTGDGSAANPHEIGSAGQLRTLIEGVKTNNGYKDKSFKLTTDIRIDMAGEGFWTPIGNGNGYFKGSFDGNGHTISGTLTGTANNFGFFGYTSGATITNLTVDATVSGGGNVGGIIGQASASTRISNCTNKRAVTGTLDCIGGIVGSLYDGSTISNCTNQGTITVIAGEGYSGGIAGYIGSPCIILGCANEGIVGGKAGMLFGGIAGYATGGSIIACYNTAAVTTPAHYGGGIAGGLASSSITTACYNIGKIAGNASSIGTIAGQNLEGCTVSYCQWVLDAANTGLLAFPSGNAGTNTKNTKHDNLAALNAAGVTALNDGIKAWNTANAATPAKHCPFHFVAGTTAGPVLKAGVPPSTSGGVDDIEPGSGALPQ